MDGPMDCEITLASAIHPRPSPRRETGRNDVLNAMLATPLNENATPCRNRHAASVGMLLAKL